MEEEEIDIKQVFLKAYSSIYKNLKLILTLTALTAVISGVILKFFVPSLYQVFCIIKLPKIYTLTGNVLYTLNTDEVAYNLKHRAYIDEDINVEIPKNTEVFKLYIETSTHYIESSIKIIKEVVSKIESEVKEKMDYQVKILDEVIKTTKKNPKTLYMAVLPEKDVRSVESLAYLENYLVEPLKVIKAGVTPFPVKPKKKLLFVQIVITSFVLSIIVSLIKQ